jgi:hypothetical protein
MHFPIGHVEECKLRGRRRGVDRARMHFGYFTLSDNCYENNYRDANQFVANIAEVAQDFGYSPGSFQEHG